MKRIAFLLVAVATVAGIVGTTAPASGHAGEEAAPIFGVKILPGYRDWRLISVAHEAGNLNDFRAILGNDVAVTAFREGKRTAQSLPGWLGVTSRRRKTFGRSQFFVAGSKDSKKYAATGGWGLLNSKTANLPTSRCTKRASPATSMSKLATLSSPITHLNPENQNLERIPTLVNSKPQLDKYRAIRECSLPISVHRYTVSENASQLIEAARFLQRGDQLPLPMSSRDCDAKDRRALFVGWSGFECHAHDNASHHRSD
jgi:hypothetical protein